MDDDFALCQPGMLCHSRWLTLVSRILLAYATTWSPTKPLKGLAHIIIEVYAPSWFWIKAHPLSKDGPKNLLKMIEFSQKLMAEEQAIGNTT